MRFGRQWELIDYEQNSFRVTWEWLSTTSYIHLSRPLWREHDWKVLTEPLRQASKPGLIVSVVSLLAIKVSLLQIFPNECHSWPSIQHHSYVSLLFGVPLFVELVSLLTRKLPEATDQVCSLLSASRTRRQSCALPPWCASLPVQSADDVGVSKRSRIFRAAQKR